MNTPSSRTQHGFRRPGRISHTPSSFPHKTPFLSSSAARTSDDIDADEPSDEIDKSPTVSRQRAGLHAVTGWGVDIEDPVQINSRHDHENSSSVHARSAPSKRRKISNYTASYAPDTVSISSSGSSIDLECLDDDPVNNHNNDEERVPVATSPPLSPTSTLKTPRTTTSRFRHVAPPTQSNAAAPSTQPRASFMSRLRQPAPERGPHPGLAFTLPEAFSPSRRRGKTGTEYQHGGSAETVRHWILEAAGRAGDEQSEVVLKVGDAVRDKGGRFVFVRTSDVGGPGFDGEENGLLWMLVDSDSHLRRGVGRKVDLVTAGAEIVVKGGKSMRWALPLGEDGKNCVFAVVWEVVK